MFMMFTEKTLAFPSDNMIKIILGLLSCISVTWSHTLHWGRSCPDIPPVPNLDINKILGPWYVLYKFDTDNSCMKWNLKNTSHPDHLMLSESRELAFLDTFGIDHTQTIDADLHLPNPEVPAKMRVRWPTSWTGSADFTIFDTDDDTSYIAVFECDRAGFFHRRSGAILSRTRNIDGLLVRRILRLMANAGAPSNSLDGISHTDCNGNGTRNYHVDSELFGLLPDIKNEQLTHIGRGVEDYDISQLEIIGDGIQPVEEFK